MRLAHGTVAVALTAAFTVGSALTVAPPAVAVPGSLTVCVKELAKARGPVTVEVGFMHGDAVEADSYPLANNKCVTVAEAPAPSGAWADASRQAKRIVVKTPSGKTNVKKSDRADFSLSSGDTVTVTFWFGGR